MALSAVQIAAAWARVRGGVEAIGADVKRIDTSAVALTNRVSAIEFRLSPRLDVDAEAFIASAQLQQLVSFGLLPQAHIDAVRVLVSDIKAAGLWTAIHCLYPFIGGNAVRHSINLKNPSLYQIGWSNAIHSSQGVTFGTGANTTGFNVPNNSPYYGAYVTGGAGLNGADFYTGFNPRINLGVFNGALHSDLGDFAGGRLSTSVGISVSRYVATTRTGGISHIFANANSVASAPTASSAPLSNTNLRLNGAPGDEGPGRRMGLMVVADALTTSQHADLYRAIHAYALALGRGV